MGIQIRKMSGVFVLFVIFGLTVPGIYAWGSSGDEKIKLKDIEVLTLRHGQWTKGRRSAGVPQLNCVGGTAASAFVPQVVQCYNRGSDGFDVQWECKTDMDNAYRFGRVEVTCEGYDYPDDPYVLKGSCGLEYTLDFTKEGTAQHQHQSQHNYYGGGGGGGPAYGWNIPPHKQKGSSTGTNLACGVVLIIIVYAIYKTCIAPSANREYSQSRTNDDYPDGRRPGAQPPPPGFNPSYFSSDSAAGDSCSGGSARAAPTGPAGGGFWTGAATGGLLGYLFGNRNNTGGGHTHYGQPRASTSYGFGGSGSSGYSTGGGGSSSSSTGTRTASGFGGTRRR